MNSPTKAEVESTMEIVGAYFINVYYNDLYLKAKSAVQIGRAASSITDVYRENVSNYMKGVKSRQPYGTVASGLHSYYQRVTVFATITFSEFENKILSHFIPAEYFRDFTEADKDAYMFALISRIAVELGGVVISQEYVRRIIDDRQNRTNISMLQDSGLAIMQQIRDEYYVEFARQINEKRDTVPAEIARKLKAAVVEETKKRCAVEKELESALNVIRGLSARLKEFDIDKTSGRVADMQKRIDDLWAEKRRLEGELAAEKKRAEAAEKKRVEAAPPPINAGEKDTKQAPTRPAVTKPASDDESGSESGDVSSESESEEDEAAEAENRRRMLAEKVAERKAKRSIGVVNLSNIDDDPWE